MNRSALCALVILLAVLDAPAQICVDEGASSPDMVRIQVWVLAAEASASVDGDNFLFSDEADLRPQVSINGGPFEGGNYVDEDDTPRFDSMFEAEVPRDQRLVPIRIRLIDRDQPFDPDNWIDLDPQGGCDQNVAGDDHDCSLELLFETCCYTFTGDGTNAVPFGCPGGVCAAGPDGYWLGPGDADEHARVLVYVQTGNMSPTCNEADVAITGAEFVQVVDRPGFAVGGRGSVLRVTMMSSFPDDVTVSAEGTIGDVVSEFTDQGEFTLHTCVPQEEMFFVDDPAVVNVTAAHYGATILTALPFTDPCVRSNDGQSDRATIAIRPARDLDVLYQRIYHPGDCDDGGDCDLLSGAGAIAEAADADDRFRGIFPAPTFTSFVDPVRHPIPFYDRLLGPRTEIQAMSVSAALLGLDRVVGLLPEDWIARHDYVPLPSGVIGVSNGKIGPHQVYAEHIPARGGLDPAHEIGHTFGLSDEPCSVDDLEIWALYKCEDEYETEVFPDRPAGGFQGTGWDVPQGVEASGTCLMDNDPDAWISNNDFESLVRKMAPGHDPAVLVISGQVTNDGGGSLLEAVGIPEGIPDRAGPSAPFNLVLRDSAGTLLGEYGIFQGLLGADEDGNGTLDPYELFGDDDDNGIPDRLPVSHPRPADALGDLDGDGIPDAVEHAEFSLRLPWPAATAQVQLVGPDGTVIDSLPIAVAAPIVDLREPVGEVRLDPLDPMSLLVPVRWSLPLTEATTAAHGVLIASSYDGGATWLPRADRVTADAFVIDARDLVTPMSMQIKVLALIDGPAGIDEVAADLDQDGCPDPIDPAPTSPDVTDRDGDGVPDVCDRCTFTGDPVQSDADGDGFGDACDADYDQDGQVSEDDRDPWFLSCMGADVIADPACFDRDFDRDGRVTAADEVRFDVELAKGRPGPSGLAPATPVAAATGQVTGCAGSGLVDVLLDGSASSDFDSSPGTNDDIVLFQWYENFGLPTQALLATGEVVSVGLATGSHGITLRVTDGTGLPDLLDAPLSVDVTDGDVDGTPDVCDNCPAAPNPAQADGDADGAGDACDCAPTDAAAWAVPGEVTGVTVTQPTGDPSLVTIAWNSLAAEAGPGVVYDVFTGPLSSLATGGFADRECLDVDDPATSLTTPQPDPAEFPGGWWYLLRAQTVCGVGTTGDATVTPDPRNALDDPSECTAPAPLLTVSKSDAPDPVPVGGTIVYTLSWANTGGGPATAVLLRDPLPAGTIFVSATGGGVLAAGVVNWNFGNVPAGGAGVVQLTVRLSSTVSSGSVISNDAYTIESAETGAVGGPPVTTLVGGG